MYKEKRILLRLKKPFVSSTLILLKTLDNNDTSDIGL